MVKPEIDDPSPSGSTISKEEDNGSGDLGCEDVISLDSQDTISDDSSNNGRCNANTKHHKSLMRYGDKGRREVYR